ncbi:MAG TPA: enoyl-CoA hydratase/isomerase family protein [Anaerolineales bacterium]|nr:enoyl-CoA hydratase/isomerase family protein [Anaerolineales bacterium]
MNPLVGFDVEDGIGQITIQRPEARNALTWQAMEEFRQCVEQASAADLRSLLVTGSGGAFCAGGDLYELDGYLTRLDAVRLSTIMADALDRLEAIPAPTIAAIEGPALGGGAEIAVACDLRVMADGAALGMMHVRLAISPAWGGGQRLLRLAGYARTLEWLAGGRVFTASEALAAGLVSRITARGQSLAEARAIAQLFAAQDPAAVRAAKRIARAGSSLPPAEAFRLEREVFPELWAAAAHREASSAFVARRNHRPRPADIPRP